MTISHLTEENFIIVVAKAYQPVCLSKEDFIKDVRYLNQIRSDITRYLKKHDRMNLRILLNRFIVATNNFGPVDAMRFAFFVVRNHHQHIVILKTLFVFLEIFPENLQITDDLMIDDNVVIDEVVLQELTEALKR